MKLKKVGSGHVERMCQSKLHLKYSFSKTKFHRLKFHRIQFRVLKELEASCNLWSWHYN